MPLAGDGAENAGKMVNGDDFWCQANAFRRKVMNPVVTDVKIDFSGTEVADVVWLTVRAK